MPATYLVAIVLTAIVAPLPAAWVYESTNEFFASADFNGDGQPDLVIVDKSSGNYRLAYQLTPGAFTWAGPRASGIENVTGFSVARFFGTNRDALAFTAPAANRVNLLDASSPSTNGLPVSIFPGQSFLLAQDFETNTRVNYTANLLMAAPGPVALSGDAGSSGRFLRLILDGVTDNRNVVAFDQYVRGGFQTIDAEFDFRMTSPDLPADGFSFMLIPTATFGRVGAGFLSPIRFEEPNIPGVFAVAFDVFDPSFDLNDVSLHWNNAQITETVVPTASVHLASGAFHHARITVRFVATGAFVSVTLTRNINGTPGAPYTAFNSFFVPGLTSYDCRVEFGASSSHGLNMSVDLDNVRVQFQDPAPTEPGAIAVGPELVTGLDLGGLGNTALDDLMVWTSWNSESAAPGNDPVRYDLIRNDGASNFPSLYAANFPAGNHVRGNAVTLKTGNSPRAVEVLRGSGSGLDQWTTYELSQGAAPPSLAVTGLPHGVDYVGAKFGSGPLSQILFFVPGQTSLRVEPITEASAGSFSSTLLANYTMPDVIRQLVMLPGAADTKLLFIFGSGGSAGVYNFDGTNQPTLVQSFTAQAGETFTGAGALSRNSFMLFSGRNGVTTSTFFQTWNFDGSAYTAGAGGNLPALTPLSAPGNVLYFRGEPFVINAPILLRTANARDWSTALAGLPGSVTVQAEAFANPTNGLSDPLSVALGPATATTTHGLVNQYREPISLFGRGPANGDTVADVSFLPAPGTSASGVSVTIRADNPNSQVFYRSGTSGPWQAYTAPICLFKTTTLYAYARSLTNGSPSRIKSATYTITTPPGTLDTDGDGVPDYVEIAKGTDPTSRDTDQDGYTDFDELTKGTSALDANSFDTNVTQKLTTFDLKLTPLPLNGFSLATGFAGPASPVRLFDLRGNLQAEGQVGATNRPFATLTNVANDQTRRLLTVATEANFAFQTPADADLGRELIGILAIPTFTNAVVTDTYTGGDLATDANNWIVAASNALAAASARPLLEAPLTILDTLAASLTERAIGQLLLARGYTPATNLTLFSFRPPDAGRDAPSLATLLALETSSNSAPACRLQTVHQTISNAVFLGAGADLTSLRSITTNIYRVSSASNYFASTNLASTNNLFYPLPLDALRQFFDTGLIHSNYYAGRSLAPEEFSSADLANARRAVTNLLASLTPRPQTNLVLQVRPDSFGGPCTLLDTTNGLASWALLDSLGAPYRLLESFNLVPGTRLRASGFTDTPTSACAAASLEVVSHELLSLPVVFDLDANSNGLPDSWEALFQITDPNGDADGDGATNLAELLAGTDPRDPGSHPASTWVSLPSAVAVYIQLLPNGDMRLNWSVPAEWAGRLDCRVLSATILGQGFTDSGLDPVEQNGNFEVLVPGFGTPARFFAVSLTAK